MKKYGLFLCSLLVLTACADDKKRLEGERLSIVEYQTSVVVDEATQGRHVSLPTPHTHSSWTQTAGGPTHATLPQSFQNQWSRQWSSSIGTGSSSNARLLSTPVIVDGVAYTLDTRLRLRAFDENSGSILWTLDLAPEDKGGVQPGGGIAFADGRIYVASPHAEVIAVDASTGEKVWHVDTEGPLRASPTVADGRVFVLSINNQLDALDSSTGKRLWSHSGITENAGLLGMASPAVSEDVVVVAYSSGEIYALKTQTGYELWSDTLSPTRRPDSLSSLAHIKAHPIIEDWQVYVVGHNQKMAAFDLRNGQRIWERRIGGTKTPAVAGDYLFMVNNFNELVCLLKSTGEVAWIKKLPDDPENPNRTMWAGPLLAGDQLILTGVKGDILTFSPQGEQLQTHRVGEEMVLPPVMANEKLFVLSEEGRLITYK